MEQLQEVVAAAFSKIVESGAIEQAIEKKLASTVNEIIDSELRSYSDFGQSLSKHVRAALGVDLSHLGLPGYNDFILKVIRKQVDAGINNVLAQQVEEQMKSLLSPPPTEIKLTDLVKQFIEANQPSDCSCDGSDRISLHIRASEHGWYWIALDEDKGKSEYSCDLHFGVSSDGGIFAITIKEKDPAKTLFVGSIYGFERSLFQMHVAGTKLIMDCTDADEIDTNYPGRGDY